MKDWDFIDRRAELFGREPDVAHLLGRCKHSGLTVVSGRPRLGKSWLLEETARRLMEMDFLVGYAESSAEQPDLLLRAVADAYARWLAQASMGDQALSLYERHKDGLVGQAGKRVGQLLKAASKAGEVGWKVAGELAAKALSGLADLDKDLKSAGLKLPSLNYEEARDLTGHLARISGKDIVLILDAWEKTPASEKEIGILDTFLDHLEDWPQTHLFLSFRVEGGRDAKLQRLRRLIQGYPDGEEYRLPAMHLDQDEERQRLLDYVQDSVDEAASEVSEEVLAEWIAGYPGVVEWWTRQAVKEELETSEDLRRAASDAQAGRYQPEFDRLLAPLETDPKLLQVAARLALLPQIASESWWESLQDTIAEEDLQQSVGHLKVRGVLDARQARFPSYGHSTRHEAARRWFLEGDLLPLVCIHMDGLARHLAAQIRSTVPATVPLILALVGLQPALRHHPASPVTAGLVEAATSLVIGPVLSPEILMAGFKKSRDSSSLAPLWAMGLFNNLNHRSHEDDRDGREQMLDELRQLAQQFPDDTAVREHLAMGLFNNLNYRSQEGNREGREKMLDELRHLAQQFHDDTAVREQLAEALFNNLNYRSQEDDRDGREQMLDELRQLAHQFPDDTAVREQLAMGLFNNLNARSQDDRDGREQMLDELRQLAQQLPDDTAVRERLAKGLFNNLIDRSHEDDRDGREQMLDELRQLAQQFPDDSAVRERLAKGLFNNLIDRSHEDDRDGREQMLDELRQLAQQFPDDTAVREPLAKGLFNNLNDRSQEDDRDGREQMLDELRQLAQQFPDDTAVRERLAKGLFNNLNDRSQEDDRDGREQMLDELRQLARQFPDDTAVREQLAMGLFNNLIDRSHEDNRDGREQMLDELRQVAEASPDNAVISEAMERAEKATREVDES